MGVVVRVVDSLAQEEVRGKGGREKRRMRVGKMRGGRRGANQSVVIFVSLVEDEEETGERKDSGGPALQLTLTIKLQSEPTILQQKPLCQP